MKKLVAALTILIAFSLLQAQTYDLAITSFAAQKQVMLEAKLIASDPLNAVNLGNSVGISGDTAVIGASSTKNGTKLAQGAVYVFVRKENVWVEQAKLIAADGARKDYFGHRVAIDGDTIVVGVPEADIGQDKDQGAVYIFTRKGNHWAEQIKLTAPGGARADIFGHSVGISGDKIIVGAPGTDTNPNDKIRTANGAAYIFTRNSNVWTQQQKLTDDHPSSVAFGMNVAIDNKTAVVSQTSDFQTSDAIYVFTNEGTSWKQEAKISSPRDADERVLMNSVSSNLAIDENTIVVGGSQKGGKSDGAVYVYVRDNGKWTRQAKLTPGDGVKEDNFGWTVDISKDTIIVGAWSAANQSRGAAYLFNRKRTPTGIVWVEQNKLTASDSLMGDFFGCSVGINNNTIIIGANNHDLKNRNSNEGAAYIFGHSGSAASSLEEVRSATSSLSSSKRTRRIALMRNARKNGFTTTRKGNAIYFQAEGVEDPITKKLLEGEKLLEYRCQANQERMYVRMKSGRSTVVIVACAVEEYIVVESVGEFGAGSN